MNCNERNFAGVGTQVIKNTRLPTFCHLQRVNQLAPSSIFSPMVISDANSDQMILFRTRRSFEFLRGVLSIFFSRRSFFSAFFQVLSRRIFPIT